MKKQKTDWSEAIRILTEQNLYLQKPDTNEIWQKTMDLRWNGKALEQKSVSNKGNIIWQPIEKNNL